MIEGLKKHSGQLANTGVRVAVVFRKIPQDDQYCLVVETDRLPDSYHDNMTQMLNSKEALYTNDFYEILNRRSFADGSNCLTALHQRGFLRKEPISNVVMLPFPGRSVPLALINATIDNKVEEYNKSLAPEEKIVNPVLGEVAKLDAVHTGDPIAIAKGLLMQADLLDQDAEAKRAEAYALAPELKPMPGRPALSAEEKEQSILDRKAKRLLRDQANAAQAKIDKKKADQDAKVLAKLKRDGARVAAEKAKANTEAPST